MTAIPKVRLLLRSIYLKGHMDGHKKTSDMSWEEDILSELRQMVGELKRTVIACDPEDEFAERHEAKGFNKALDSVMEKLK